MRKLVCVGMLCALLSACTSPFEKQVKADFEAKKALFSQGDFFGVFDDEGLTAEERDALMFFYAYMPVGDITDYSGNFYLENIRSSFATREETEWGKKIPDDVFRHFVLPVRVNNEALDRSRMVFHDELMPRLKGLAMYDAVLEVNHWCHEKANYQPSDARTSSPLATVRTAYGRCGEESTFLVAALRSVGIPARQVYTPRWAHTDDNHAWVEAWVDGKWYFLGACEPEPVLNLGWFNEPASRGMLMHTKVFGYYEGPEEVMRTTANYTEINVIGNYAQNAPVTVLVTDIDGKPVGDACVRFGIYNYAEFYPVSSQKTGADGRASLSAGLGDMVVLAVKGRAFGIQKVSFGKDKEVELRLEHQVGDTLSFSLDIVPPAGDPTLPEVTPEQRAENDIRFNREDSIRHAYIASFPGADAIRAFASETGYDAEAVAPYIVASRGNASEIEAFLKEAAGREMRSRALDLLGTLAEKDLRDAEASVLDDHLYHTDSLADVATVLAPRIGYEMLTPYRSFFQREIPETDAARFREKPLELVEWCKDSLTLRDDLCTVGTVISPEGVWKSRMADRTSRNTFFVAVARSLGIPAWIDRVTGYVLYKENGKDVAVDFESGRSEQVAEGTLKLDYTPIPRLGAPSYARHFSLSRFDGEGFALQVYPDFEPWSKLFKEPVPVPAGYYMLVSGTRLAKGGVLAQVSFFGVEQDKETDAGLVMRESEEAVSVIGSFNSESKFQTPEGGETSVLLTTGRGYFIVGILGVGDEPTNHALKDIAAKASELEKWGRKIVLLFPSRATYEKYQSAPIEGLPSTVVFGIDADGSIEAAIRQEMKLQAGTRLPVFIVADTFNRVVFESHGYTIGMGDQLLHTVHGL